MDEVYKIIDKISNVKIAHTLRKLVDKVFICPLEDVAAAYNITLGAILMAEVLDELSKEDGKAILNSLKIVMGNHVNQHN